MEPHRWWRGWSLGTRRVMSAGVDGASVMTVILVVILVVVIGGIVIAIFGWEPYRGGGVRGPATPSEGAQPTSEVFIDPDTGRRMRSGSTSGPGTGSITLNRCRRQPASPGLLSETRNEALLTHAGVGETFRRI